MAKSVPAWIKQIRKDRKRKRYAEWWRKPWTVPRSRLRARHYKRGLWRHGRVTTNFTKAEAASSDGKGVGRLLRPGCQRHGFKLERVRHANGDRAMRVISWLRSWAVNRAAGGAIASRHLFAVATDWAIVAGGVNDDFKREFRLGGIGTCASNGRVRHVDNGPTRRWTYNC